ncbi:hypothetical protein QX201_000166 [Fusarium graminearum]|nr:hypothetical protein HG531_002771 [Fusarium graminearum]CAF3554265.1 unnamed protein product [Fusarium graminearum]CAF3571274.1 unnamed protein product [Fusarium graminearum]
MQEYASHVPLPESDASVSEPDSDVELPSRFLDTSEVYVYVQNWLPEPSKEPIPRLAGTLFEAILALFIHLTHYVAIEKDGKHIALGSRELVQEVERLFLWGDGFSASSGQLDEILSKSSELRQSVLSSLYELGVTLKNTALQTRYTSHGNKTRGLDIPMRELRGLLEQTSILLYGSDSLDDRDAISESGSSTNDLTKCIEDISIYIDCLMDLSVALENPVLDLEPVNATIPSSQNLETFDVSSSQASTFCRKIRDRFPKMEKWLVERLGENNARRASALKEAHERCLDIEATNSTNVSDPVLEDSNTASSRQPAPMREFPHIPASNSSFLTRALAITDGPYTCTIRTCILDTKSYKSTRRWVEHESQHRPQDWQGSECPFCDSKSTLMSPKSYYKHVAEHLREISLAALPHSFDSHTDTTSSNDNSEDNED